MKMNRTRALFENYLNKLIQKSKSGHTLGDSKRPHVENLRDVEVISLNFSRKLLSRSFNIFLNMLAKFVISEMSVQ